MREKEILGLGERNKGWGESAEADRDGKGRRKAKINEVAYIHAVYILDGSEMEYE